MKRILHIISLGSLLALSACEIPFEIEQEGQPKIYVQAIADRGVGVISIKPRYATPIGQEPLEDVNYEATLEINGENVPLTGGGPNPFLCRHTLSEGDEISVKVWADGLPAAEGRTTMVPTPVITDMTWEEVQADTILATRVHLTLQHAPQEGEHYAIQIMVRTSITYLDGNTAEFLSYTVPGYALTAAESGVLNLEDFLQVNYSHGSSLGGEEYQPLTLLEMKHFKGNEYSFYLNSYDQYLLEALRENMPEGDTGIAGGGIASGNTGGQLPGGGVPIDPSRIPIGMKTTYFFYMYRLSSEFYYYAKALYQSNFDFLSNMGLTPANFTYSNVRGGLGFVGAASRAVSDELVIEKSLIGENSYI